MPPAPSGSSPSSQRRIRCKMCRQELAMRENIVDHGRVLGTAAAALGNASTSQRPSSMSIQDEPDGQSELEPEPESIPIDPSATLGNASHVQKSTPIPAVSRPRPSVDPSTSTINDNEPRRPTISTMTGPGSTQIDSPMGRTTTVHDPTSQLELNKTTTIDHTPPTHLSSPADLSAQLFANPQLAALRSTPASAAAAASPRILANPRCSGYFVEPMKWMDHFLSAGQPAGKMTCPNKKCGAKLGNYDWAGVCCGCEEWVTPGFCVNRSKVDEVL